MVVKYLHALLLLLLLLLLTTIKAAEIPSNTNVSPRNFYEVLEVKKGYRVSLVQWHDAIIN